jgi:hypothetical protein
LAQNPRIVEFCREYAEQRYCSTSIARGMLNTICESALQIDQLVRTVP